MNTEIPAVVHSAIRTSSSILGVLAVIALASGPVVMTNDILLADSRSGPLKYILIDSTVFLASQVPAPYHTYVESAQKPDYDTVSTFCRDEFDGHACTRPCELLFYKRFPYRALPQPVRKRAHELTASPAHLQLDWAFHRGSFWIVWIDEDSELGLFRIARLDAAGHVISSAVLEPPSSDASALVYSEGNPCSGDSLRIILPLESGAGLACRASEDAVFPFFAFPSADVRAWREEPWIHLDRGIVSDSLHPLCNIRWSVFLLRDQPQTIGFPVVVGNPQDPRDATRLATLDLENGVIFFDGGQLYPGSSPPHNASPPCPPQKPNPSGFSGREGTRRGDG